MRYRIFVIISKINFYIISLLFYIYHILIQYVKKLKCCFFLLFLIEKESEFNNARSEQ